MKKFISIVMSIVTLIFITAVYSDSVYGASATMTLSPASKSLTTGEVMNVTVTVNTGGARTAATDMVITFDRTKLILLDMVSGTAYDQYVGKQINNAVGAASLSGLVSSPDQLFSGEQTFATLQFQALAPGTASVNFNFTPGVRSDTGVYDFDADSEDILTSVTNGSYNITGTAITVAPTNSTSPGTATTTTTTQTGQTTQKGSLPVTASPAPTVGLGILGILIVWLSTLWSRIFG